MNDLETDERMALPVCCIFVLSLLVLALFQSSALVTASYDLPPGDLSQVLVSVAEAWNGLVEKLGAAGVTEVVSERVLELHDDTPVSE